MTDKTNVKAVQANVRSAIRYISGALVGSAGIITAINPTAGAAAGAIGTVLQNPEVVGAIGVVAGLAAEVWFWRASK